MPSRRARQPSVVGALAGLLLALVAGAPPAAAAGPPVVDWEQNLRPDLLSFGYPRNDAFDPIVATHPTDPAQIAVSYHWKPKRGAPCGFSPGLRISTDAGASWHEAARRPWAGSGRQPNWHATIAWGPGPTGAGRLYWADTTVASCTFSDHRLSVAWSDDRGATWSPLFVYKGTPATSAGGYPDITVDRNPASPSYGAIYAAINWFASGAEPGYRVIASADHGQTWTGHEIPPLPAAQGYPYRYRIGYRLRSAPDGALYASFCQRDRRSPGGATGRLAFGVARLTFDLATSALTGQPPALATKVGNNKYNLSTGYAPGTSDWQALGTCWSHGIDVDAAGRLYLAVSNYRPKAPSSEARGVIRLGRSDDGGQSWDWQLLPVAADLKGRHQSSYRPTLVVSGDAVFVGLHLLVDVALGSKSAAATVANAYSVSYDRGGSFSQPLPISDSRWHLDWLDHARNGPGIRDRAELTADGRVIYVYGDGRHAAAKPDPRWGRGAVYVTAISLGVEPPPGP